MRRFYYLLEIMAFLFFMGCSFWGNYKPATTEVVSNLPLILTPVPFLPPSDMVDLYCENYVTTRWGRGDAEWGFPDGFHGSIRTRLLPLRFDSDQRLYFFDFVNGRLIVYKKGIAPKLISLKPILFWQEQPYPFLFSITLYKDKIFVPYYYNRVGILSTTGEVLGIVALPISYDVFLPAESIVEIDPIGRLCTFKGIYDIGWENDKWKKIEGGCMDTFFWGNYSVTGDKNLEVVNEVLEIRNFVGGNPLFLDTGLPKSNYPLSSLFGIDKVGNAYLVVSVTPPTWTYAKYNLVTHKAQIGQLQLETNYTTAIPSVSPDGALYIIAYAEQDMSVQPRIIKCEIPEH